MMRDGRFLNVIAGHALGAEIRDAGICGGSSIIVSREDVALLIGWIVVSVEYDFDIHLPALGFFQKLGKSG